MPVSGFTVAHDFEAQAYNKQRAAYLAAEKERKRAEKASKEAAKRDLRAMQKGMKQIEKSEIVLSCPSVFLADEG